MTMCISIPFTMLPAKVHISFGAILLFGVFALLASADVLLAVAAAVLFHEAGHAAALRCMGSGIRSVSANCMGLTMYPKKQLSYTGELLTLLAGPGANLTAFFLFGMIGKYWQFAYTLSGAQLLLGLFNLLPICGMDGSSILWILAALLWEPYTADRITVRVSIFFSAALVAFSGMLVCRSHGGWLLLWTSLGLFLRGASQLGLVKRPGKR